MKYKFLLIGLILANFKANAQSNSSDLYDIKIQTIKDNIYLAYRTEPLRKFVQGNVTIIINEKDVVLVDAGGSVTVAKKIIAAVKKLTNNPIRYVINTHFHADHTLGNEEYVRSFPGVEIISHSLTKKDLVEKTSSEVESFITSFAELRSSEQELIDQVTKEAKPGYEKVVAYLSRYTDKDIFTRRDEYAKLKVTPATLICDQKIILNRGSRTIEIMYIGPGDTPGDLVVYLPQDKIVCSGDMVVHPVPYGFSKNPLAWIETLTKLSGLEFDYLVPGHGDLQKGKTYISEIIDLLQSVHAQVKGGIAKGVSKEVLQQEIDLSYFTQKYLNEDPVAMFRFKRWFSNPAIENAYKLYSK